MEPFLSDPGHICIVTQNSIAFKHKPLYNTEIFKFMALILIVSHYYTVSNALLKGQFTKKPRKFCHLLIPMLFQAPKTYNFSLKHN